MYYIVVFHGRDRIGYAERDNERDAEAYIDLCAGSYLRLLPLPGHAMSALSDDGTYVIPFDRAEQIVIVSDLSSLHVNLE